jgi:ribosomal protein L11 methyltransferase
MEETTGQAQWLTVRVVTNELLVDPIAEFLSSNGSQGVMIDDERSDAVIVTGYVPSDAGAPIIASLEAYLADLAVLFPDTPPPRFETEDLKQENWATAWKDNFKPVYIGGRLLVSPPWLQPEANDRVVILIEPAEAFGTGTHETTQGCLELLEIGIDSFLSRGTIPSVLDMGTGSGILAIAAVKLGAKPVTAVDNDPVAVRSARENAELNGVVDALALAVSDADSWPTPADIVTANLDSRTLKAHRDQLMRLCRGLLIVSGVTNNQWEDVKGVLLGPGVRLERELVKLEWTSALLEVSFVE